MDEVEFEKPRTDFAKKHAKKAFQECAKLFPEGFPSSLKIAIPQILPGYQMFPLENLPNSLSAITLKDHKKIGYNKNHPEVRIRFSVAHEIGHIRMEHPDWVFGPDSRTDKILETEADMFAGVFLVPPDSLKNEFVSCRDYSELAIKFGVSKAVMLIRFKETRLLNQII